MPKHKWHKEIIAWANGGFIESRECAGMSFSVSGYGVPQFTEWALDSDPEWNDSSYEYRIKPEPTYPFREGKIVYVASPTEKYMCFWRCWYVCDKELVGFYQRGLVFADKDSAINAAKKMIASLKI